MSASAASCYHRMPIINARCVCTRGVITVLTLCVCPLSVRAIQRLYMVFEHRSRLFAKHSRFSTHGLSLQRLLSEVTTFALWCTHVHWHLSEEHLIGWSRKNSCNHWNNSWNTKLTDCLSGEVWLVNNSHKLEMMKGSLSWQLHLVRTYLSC